MGDIDESVDAENEDEIKECTETTNSMPPPLDRVSPKKKETKSTDSIPAPMILDESMDEDLAMAMALSASMDTSTTTKTKSGTKTNRKRKTIEEPGLPLPIKRN